MGRSPPRSGPVRAPAAARDESGQAALELLAGLPALALAALVAFQLLVTGYTLHLADGAAEAGALALAGGAPVAAAARDALPGWARGRVDVGRDGGTVRVRVRPPVLPSALAEALEVSSTASVRIPDG